MSPQNWDILRDLYEKGESRSAEETAQMGALIRAARQEYNHAVNMQAARVGDFQQARNEINAYPADADYSAWSDGAIASYMNGRKRALARMDQLMADNRDWMLWLGNKDRLNAILGGWSF